MKDIISKIEKYCKYYDWDLAGKSTLLAVSGGRDSMTLLQYFVSQKYSVQVAHVNFGLRVKEADTESQLVKDTCLRHSIPFHFLEPDTKSYAKENGLSTQEAARILRYRFFDEIADAQSLDYIATAHHAEDNVETFLMRLMDGAGLQGLSGIPPQNGRVIRPLLQLDEQEMNTLVNNMDVKFLDDSSNSSEDYTRNHIRHQLLPKLKEVFGEKYPNVSESIEHLRESQMIFERSVQQKIEKLKSPQSNVDCYNIRQLIHLQPLNTWLYELFKPYGLKSSQVSELLKLLHSSSGKVLHTDTHIILRDRNQILVTRRHEKQKPVLMIDEPDMSYEGEDYRISIQSRIRSAQDLNTSKEFYISAKKVDFPLVVRPWRKGDYFYPEGLGKKKKISDYFSDIKLNILEKQQVDILCHGDHILAVLGHRMDHRFLTEVGQQCFRIRYYKK